MQLAVSTGCCYPFLGTEAKRINFLASLAGKVDGIEFVFASTPDLMQFHPEKRTLAQLAGFGFVNAHYPFLEHTKPSAVLESRLVKKLEHLNGLIGLKHVIVHPLAVNSWQRLQESELTFLAENLEVGNEVKWQTPAAIEKLLEKTGLDMCFDLNHALSCGIKPIEFLPLKEKIKQVHVNSTEKFGKEAEHGFLSDSSAKTMSMVKPVLQQLKNAVWVIEPKSKKNPSKQLQKEIKMLRKFSST